MKKVDLLKELRGLSLVDLASRMNLYRRDLLSLKLKKLTDPPKDFASRVVFLRRSIARCLTVLNESLHDGK